MDAITFNCPGCGEPVDIDFKTRKGCCEWCGNIVTIPRKTFNQDDKVQNELVYAVQYFKEKRFEDAKQHADNVLSVSIDNAPALFIRTYYESFCSNIKHSERMSYFFHQLNEIEVDEEEITPLVELFLLSALKLVDYETEILSWAKDNLARDDLLKLVDGFSPLLISKRNSIDFFTSDLANVYKQISEICSMPKTCFALLQSIEKNPDSPYIDNRFFLKTKTQRFYNTFVLPIGEIIKNMDSLELKEKFYSVYQKSLKTFENRMNGGTN